MKKRKMIGFAVLLSMLFILHCGTAEAKSKEKQPEEFANVVLFAHFADNADAATAYFSNPDNKEEILEIYDGAHGRSFTNYLNTISYGQFHIKNIFPQAGGDGQGIASYQLSMSKNEAMGDIDSSIIGELLNAGLIPQSAVVDYNGDGLVDNLTVILYSDTDAGGTLISHHAYYPSGQGIGHYTMFTTYSLTGTTSSGSAIALESGVALHEFLHIFEYPDLYTSDGQSFPVYLWDIMGSVGPRPSYPLAYLRMKFTDWIEIETITESKNGLVLHAQDNKNGNQAYILKSPLNEQEFFVVEFRKKAAYNPMDKDTLDYDIGGSGMIVYRVNTQVNGLTNLNGQTGIYVFRPQPGQSGYNAAERLCVQNAYLSAESGRTSIGSSDMNQTLTDGALTFSDGTNSGIVISNVSGSSGDQMTFDVNIPTVDQFDTWKDTGVVSPIPAAEIHKMASITSYNKVPYLAVCSQRKLYTYKFDGQSWKQIGSVVDIQNPSAIEVQLFSTATGVYFAYADSDNARVVLKHLDEQSGGWTETAVLSGSSMYFQFQEVQSKLYVAYTTSDSKSAKLAVLNGNSFQELGTYRSGQGCVRPKICEANGEIYVSVFDALNAVIQIYRYDGSGQFERVNEDSVIAEKSEYDMEALDNRIYLVVPRGESKSLRMLVYDGNVWTETTDTGIFCGQPEAKLVSTQGNLYLLFVSAESTTQVQRYDTEKGAFVQEGINVDSAAQHMSLAALDNQLFVSYIRDLEDSTRLIMVKMKTTEDELLSLTITPPSKTVYTQGDQVNITGLKVVANYTSGSREIASNTYQLTGFDTKTTGTRKATVTYGGKAATFSYEVRSAPVNELKSLTITPPKKTVYTQGDPVDTTGLKVVANYTNGSKEIASSAYKLTGFDTRTVGARKATVTYEGKTATFSYEVRSKTVNELKSLTITPPKKTVYTQGDPVDTTGLKVVANYTNGSKEIASSAYKLTGFDTRTVGTRKATVTYGGKTATFSFTVKAKEQSKPTNPTKPTPAGSVSYRTHVQSIGWQEWRADGKMSGTSGQAKRLEGIEIKLNHPAYSGGIEYRTHVQSIGWQEWRADGKMSGTSGQAKRLEAIQIRLTGEMAQKYDVYYRVHAQTFGWMGWAKNGGYAGTAGYAKRLESIEIRLVVKGAAAPGGTQNAYRHPFVTYQTHVQSYGWQSWVRDGEMSGTSGQAKRLEGIQIILCNQEFAGDIEYRTHVQTYSWQDWVRNGEMSGTSGQAKRLEAIQIRLTGEMAQRYDVYYRVHAQTFGWMGWAKNGEQAGTAGYAKRLEGIQIVLVPRGGAAPGNTENAFVQR